MADAYDLGDFKFKFVEFFFKEIEDRSLELTDMIKDKKISKRKAVVMLMKEFPDHLDAFYKAIILDSLAGARWYKELAD